MRIGAGIIASLLMGMMAAPHLHAFCFEPKIRVDDEFFVSDLVFTGTIVADDKTGMTPEGFYDGHDFTWRVSRVFRGAVRPGDFVHTYSEDGSGRFPLEAEEGHQVGRRFLIFAFPDPTHKGVFGVDDCGNSVPLAKAASKVGEILQLPHRHGSVLYGEMFDWDEGVRIVATGADRTYSTLSDSHGKFELHVRPGNYSVAATKPGHIYTDFEFAYKPANAVRVPDGGSAGVAFREKGK
jgi:hypothetical protein